MFFLGYDTINATIVIKEFKFKDLQCVKQSIKSTVNYCIRDAKFKLVHQPKGKDSKRFLKIIEDNL